MIHDKDGWGILSVSCMRSFYNQASLIIKAFIMVGIPWYPCLPIRRKVHKNSKTKQIDLKNKLGFLEKYLRNTILKLCGKFHSNETCGRWINHITKFCWRRNKSTARNDDFWTLTSADPKGISRFCKPLYILLDKVDNYKTQLIDERQRNELRNNGTLTLSRLRVIRWHGLFFCFGAATAAVVAR